MPWYLLTKGVIKMKYGFLSHIGFQKSGGEGNKRIVSMGDIFEGLALRNIYNRMGIKENELVSCHHYEMSDYMGEYIVVPINVYQLNLNWSKRILPVFLGLTLGGEHEISNKDIALLRRFQPIGCRDERTMRMLLDLGIQAYLQGCLVATFDEREQNLPTQKKVFFVDANAGIKDFIPDDLLEDYEFFSHDFYINTDTGIDGRKTKTSAEFENNMLEFGIATIERYKKEARLIVTSKYHAALIGLALGIPVILVMENNYYKYSWIEKFIPVYEPKDFRNINWNPDKVVIPRKEKDLMIEIAIKRISETYNKYIDICTLSEYRERLDIEKFEDIFYGAFAIEYIKDNWDKNIEIEYGLWGATDTSLKLNQFIFDNYPNARLAKVYDWSVRNSICYAEGEFVPVSLDQLESKEGMELFIFVTGNSASQAAKELFGKMNKENYFLCERKILSESDVEK